jgi:hypothetical protein
MIAADLDADGRVDLATSGHILHGRGDGLFDPIPHHQGGVLVAAADIDGDRLLDLAFRGTILVFQRTAPPFSQDVNQNGLPDECETRFHRGDPNSSGTTDITDGVDILGFLFLGGPALVCRESADVNNNGTIDITDGIALLNWLFLGGPEPAAPGPTTAPCGVDPDIPGSTGDLGCDSYGPCN